MIGRLFQFLGGVLAAMAILLAIPVFLIVAPFVITYLLCGALIVKFHPHHTCPTVPRHLDLQVERGLAQLSDAIRDMKAQRIMGRPNDNARH